MVAANLVQLREEYDSLREDGNRWAYECNGAIVDIWQSGRYFFWAVSAPYGREHGRESSKSMAEFCAKRAAKDMAA